MQNLVALKQGFQRLGFSVTSISQSKIELRSEIEISDSLVLSIVPNCKSISKSAVPSKFSPGLKTYYYTIKL